VVGGDEWAENPRLVLPPEWLDLVRMWHVCRGESGIAHWPDAGGIGDQAAWVVDAFQAISSIDARDRAEQQRRSGT
jgi:hypothetical protein